MSKPKRLDRSKAAPSWVKCGAGIFRAAKYNVMDNREMWNIHDFDSQLTRDDRTAEIIEWLRERAAAMRSTASYAHIDAPSSFNAVMLETDRLADELERREDQASSASPPSRQ